MRFRHETAMPRSGVLIGATGTALIHSVLVGFALFAATRSAQWQPTIYSVELVAAPTPTATRAPADPVPTPPAPPVVNPAPKPTAKTAPIPKKVPPKVDPKTEPAPAKPSKVEPAKGATPSTGTDVDNVRVAGEAFPFPDYLRNIMNQILRRWARPTGAGALTAEVSFTIMRDGSVQDIKVIQTSRSYSFDLEAQGAIEQAATDRAFGPLPNGWPADLLKVAFLFTPRPR